MGLLGRTILAFSLTSGRMRYAPTLVRLKSWGCWVNTSCKFIRYKHHISVKFAKRCRGVSHTPSMAAKLHVRGWWFVGCYHFIFNHVRAYAIRPYTCSAEILGLLGRVLLAFSITSGRMRYAHTFVRLKSWVCWVVRFCVSAHFRAYAIRPYTCSIEILGLLGSTFRAFSLI